MKRTELEPATSPEDQRLLDLACASLDESVQALDGQTLSRLNQARQTALADSTRSRLQRAWLPAGAVALTLVIALSQLLPPHPAQTVEPGLEESWISLANDAELVEDLDLVLWLMDDEDHAS